MIDYFMPELPVHFLVGYMLVACVSIPILHVVFIRVTKMYGEKGLPLMASSAVCLIGWCLGFLYAWFSNPSEFDTSWIPHALTSLFIYFGFVLGYVEFFSLINRGYSLSIMMDIYRRNAPPKAIELEHEYAGGRGLKWMLTKRVNGLIALGFVIEKDGELYLKKRWPARFAWFLHKVFRTIYEKVVIISDPSNYKKANKYCGGFFFSFKI